MKHYIEQQGDLVKREDITVMVHQCNCFATMGAGIAKQIKNKYPVVAQKDREWQEKKGSKDIFGTILPVELPDGRICVNMYSQYHYGSNVKQTDEAMFKQCLGRLIRFTDTLPETATIGFPKYIGCGLAGGNWDEVERYIDVFAGLVKQRVYVIDFAG